MPTPPDFEDLIKQIKPAATAQNVAAATIALRLIRSQGIPHGSLSDVFAPGGQFELTVASIKNQISTL